METVKDGLTKGLSSSSEQARLEMQKLSTCLESGGLSKGESVKEVAKKMITTLFDEIKEMGQGLPEYAKQWTEKNGKGMFERLLKDGEAFFNEDKDPDYALLLEEIEDKAEQTVSAKALQVVDAAQGKIKRLMRTMGTQLTANSNIDPKLGCIVVYMMMMTVEFAMPDASKVVEMAMQELENLWTAFKESKMVTNLMDRVSEMSGLDKVKDYIEKFDEKAATFVRSKCVQSRDYLLDMAGGEQEKTEAIFCAVVQIQRSDLFKKAVEGAKKGASAVADTLKRFQDSTMSEVAQEMVGEAMGKLLQVLDEKLLADLEARVAADVLAKIDVLLESLLAACGLIPEAGAAICASFTVMLQQALPETIAPMVGKFMAYIKEQIYSKVTTEVKQAVGNVFDNLANKTGLAEVRSKISTGMEESGAASAFKMLPVVWKFIKTLYPLMFKSLNAEIEACKELYLELGTILCFTPPAPPASPPPLPPPPNFGRMWEYATPKDGASLGIVFGPVAAMVMEGCSVKSADHADDMTGSVFYHGHLKDGKLDGKKHSDGIGLYTCIALDSGSNKLVITSFTIGSQDVFDTGGEELPGHSMIFNPAEESRFHNIGTISAEGINDQLKVGTFEPVTPEMNAVAFDAYNKMTSGGSFHMEFVRFALPNDINHPVPHSKDGTTPCALSPPLPLPPLSPPLP